MSKYTTQLRFYIEAIYANDNKDDIDSMVSNACQIIFGDFPIFDEKYRAPLCKKILYHFYFHEIGYETIGLWKFALNRKMREIMPYYNQLYMSELLEFNPLYSESLNKSGKKDFSSSKGFDSNSNTNEEQTTSDVLNRTEDTLTDEKFNETNNSTTNVSSNFSNENTTNSSYNDDTKTDSTTTNHLTKLFSDTPQGSINGLNTGSYLTSAEKTDSDEIYETSTHVNHSQTGSSNDIGSGNDDTIFNGKTNSNRNTDFNLTSKDDRSIHNDKNTGNVFHSDEGFGSSEEYLDSVSGYSGRTPSSMLLEFRETFLNIDMMVIDNLNNLFMSIW